MSELYGAPSQGAVEALYATGHWLFAQQRAKDAACVFRAMMLAAPSDERAWIGLGACHEEEGDDAVALEIYSLGAQAARPSPRCEIARARMFRSGGQVREAADALEIAEEMAVLRDDEDLRALVLLERGAT